jgi:hypothetical protein
MSNEELVCAPVGVTEEETWAAAEYIMRAVAQNGLLRESLHIIRYNGLHIKRNIRSITIKEHRQKQKDNLFSITSEIVLRGKWMQRVGFEPGGKVWALPFAEALIIIPQVPAKNAI